MTSTIKEQAGGKLSVLIFSPHPSVQGGVSVFIQTVKENLPNCAVTPFWIGSSPEQEESKIAQIFRLIFAPFMAICLAWRRRFDVIHLNPTLDTRSSIRDGLILLALRLAGCRQIMVYFHGWEPGVEKCIKRIPLLRRFFAWLLNGTGLVLVLSPEFKKALEEMGVSGERVIFTRTMFDGHGIRDARNNAAAPERASILFMSRFIREKGVYELLEAFARIAGEFPGFDLVMAGGGPEEAGLKARAAALGISDRIRFPGYMRGKEKFRLLYDCAVFALPTYAAEGMPVALLEAMGAGKPLLTGNTGVIPHIISDPENGVVLGDITVDTVEKALRRLLSDPAYCAGTGKRNEAYAWDRFEAGKVTAEIEGFYNSVARLI